MMNVIVRKAEAVVRVVLVVREFSVRAVEFVKSFTAGAKPQHAVAIFRNTQHVVVGEAIRVAGIMFVVFELVAVIAIETIRGAEPQKALTVLKNGVYCTLCKAVFNGNTFELELGLLRMEGDDICAAGNHGEKK